MADKIIVTAELCVREFIGQRVIRRYYLKLRCPNIQRPIATVESTEDAIKYCDLSFGKGNWELRGDEL